MSLLDRFLAERQAAKKINETDMHHDPETMKRLDHLPPEERQKWIGIYVGVYNDMVDARGTDKSKEIAARSAWSRIPDRYKGD